MKNKLPKHIKKSSAKILGNRRKKGKGMPCADDDVAAKGERQLSDIDVTTRIQTTAEQKNPGTHSAPVSNSSQRHPSSPQQTTPSLSQKWILLRSQTQNIRDMMRMEMLIDEKEVERFHESHKFFKNLIQSSINNPKTTARNDHSVPHPYEASSQQERKLISDIIKNHEFSPVEETNRQLNGYLKRVSQQKAKEDTLKEQSADSLQSELFVAMNGPGHLRSLSMPFLRPQQQEEEEDARDGTSNHSPASPSSAVQLQQKASNRSTSTAIRINSYDLNHLRITSQITEERYLALCNLEAQTDDLTELLRDVNRLVHEGDSLLGTSQQSGDEQGSSVLLENVQDANQNIEKSILSLHNHGNLKKRQRKKRRKKAMRRFVTDAVLETGACIIS